MQSLNNKKVSKKQVRWVAKVLQIALGSSMFSMSLGARITNQITLQKWSKRKVLSTLVVLVTTILDIKWNRNYIQGSSKRSKVVGAEIHILSIFGAFPKF